jgi:hypothetical protein
VTRCRGTSPASSSSLSRKIAAVETFFSPCPTPRVNNVALAPIMKSRAREVSRRAEGLGTLLGGGVSERPKEHASKACEGATPPWVQIPPPPL